MKFGLFCLLAQRDPSVPIKRIYDDTIAQVQLAEQLEFGTAWFAEHHFSNYCVCPSPLLMASHVAAQTARIRLGTAVLVLPLYNPVRVLEEIGMVDNLSDGRLEIGIGAGYQEYEFARFNRKLAENYEISHEMLDILELGLNQQMFSYQGKHLQLPELPVAVTTLQQPSPPISVTGNQPRILQRAALKGYTVFTTVGYNPVANLLKVKQHIADNFNAAGVDPATMRLAVQRYIFITDDKREARMAAENALYTTRLAMSLRNNYQKLKGTELQALPFAEELSLDAILDNTLIGDAESCIEKLSRELQLLQPAHLSCFMQFGGIDGRAALRSLERFGRDVLPGLRREMPQLDSMGELAEASAAAD